MPGGGDQVWCLKSCVKLVMIHPSPGAEVTPATQAGRVEEDQFTPVQDGAFHTWASAFARADVFLLSPYCQDVVIWAFPSVFVS